MTGTVSFTYNSLIAAIQTWAEDDSAELVAALPDIVGKGESRLYTDLNLEIFDSIAVGTFDPNVQVQAVKPSTWQNTRSMWWEPIGGGARTYMERRTVDWIVYFQPDETIGAGEPQFYAELDDTQYLIAPSPDLAYPFFCRQIAQVADMILAVGQQATWLASNVGDILLDSCMIEAEQYTKSDQYDVDKWKQLYSEKLPQRRMELRSLIRSDYSPIMNAARTVDDRP
jgi:hypothetical protein